MLHPNETLSVKSPLPIARYGGVRRLWLKLQVAGMLKLAGLGREPVQVDAYRILGATKCKPIIRVGLIYRGITAGGGSLVSASEALQKAFGEFCECLLFFDENHILGQTRSGWAAAADEDTAKTRAYYELIERDSLITHFLCPEVRALPLSPPEYATLPVRLARLWSADPTVQVVLCGLQDSPDGFWFLGAGGETEAAAAAAKAYEECVSVYCGYWHVKESAADPVTPANLMEARKLLIMQHIRAGAHPAMRRHLEAIFTGEGTVQPDFATSRAAAVFQTRARLGKRLVIVSATHPQLCRLSFGRLWQDCEAEIIGLLKGRNLNPVWGVHPFA